MRCFTCQTFDVLFRFESSHMRAISFNLSRFLISIAPIYIYVELLSAEWRQWFHPRSLSASTCNPIWKRGRNAAPSQSIAMRPRAALQRFPRSRVDFSPPTVSPIQSQTKHFSLFPFQIYSRRCWSCSNSYSFFIISLQKQTASKLHH